MPQQIITTNKGKITGVDQNSYTIYKGIPYAKPPIGELRWKAPQDTDVWEGIYEAVSFGPICYQPGQEGGTFYEKEFYSDKSLIPPMSEDCLYLNIWVPKDSHNQKLPVAFWIHGGAFINGFGNEIEFDGEAFCKKGVILVTINYRLGALGFLAHPWFSAENNKNISGNYGILDQIAALNWVYDNIEAFGGDPGKITVFGQSAGSMSVQTLVSSPLTKGKIYAAVFQSAGGYHAGLNRDWTLAEAEKLGVKFTSLCGVSTLDELRALPGDIILAKSMELFGIGIQEYNHLPYIPVIDQYVLQEGYDEVVDHGLHHDIPYLIGSTKNDIGVTEEQLKNNEKSQLYYGCIDWSLKLEELQRNPAYVYYFTRELLGDDAGAFHSAELWYIFGTLKRSWRPKEEADYKLSEQMVEYWTNFMKTGNPNGEGTQDWKPCTKENRFVKELK